MNTWLKLIVGLLLLAVLLAIGEWWLRTYRRPMLATPTDYLQPRTATLGFSDVEDRIRLVALGDSIVNGYLVSAEESWPGRLETLLHAQRPGTPWMVVNSGISGETAVQGLARLERDALRFRPHVLFVAFGLNDCYLAYSEADAWRQAETFPRQAYGSLGDLRLYRALRLRLSAAEPWRSEGSDSLRPRADPEIFRMALQETVRRARQADVPQIVLLTMTPVAADAHDYWPGAVQRLQMALYEQYNDIIREVAQSENVGLIESASGFDNARLDSLLQDDGIHLTAAGQEQMAHTVFAALQIEGLLESLGGP